MQKKLLLDGCSFTYGFGLQRHETLEHLFIESGYEVLNLSRPGKSNQSIALDVYNNAAWADIVVIGWTFSSRWHLRYHNLDIDLLANRQNIELPHNLDSNEIEQTYQELHRGLYSLFDQVHWDNVSNMLIDNTSSQLKQQDKQMVFFSIETRNTTCPVYYPHIRSSYRLPDGHFNGDGTRYLFNNLTAILEQ